MTNAKQLTFSLIVPFYKVEAYIGACLESCVSQTYPHLEILCVDDASPDRSLDVVREFMKKDDRIQLITHAKNKGLGGARNTGLAQASGDYIWFIDSDDTISPDACEILAQKITQYGEPDVVCADYSELDCFTNELVREHVLGLKETYSDARIIETAISTSIICAWLKICRRSLLADFRFRENTTAEDIDSFSWFYRAQSVVTLPVSLYAYRIRRPGSITTENDLGFSSDVVRNTYFFLEETQAHPALTEPEKTSVLYYFSGHIADHLRSFWQNCPYREKRSRLREAKLILSCSERGESKSLSSRLIESDNPLCTFIGVNRKMGITVKSTVKRALRPFKRYIKTALYKVSGFLQTLRGRSRQ